jgi:hypothetical protein
MGHDPPLGQRRNNLNAQIPGTNRTPPGKQNAIGLTHSQSDSLPQILQVIVDNAHEHGFCPGPGTPGSQGRGINIPDLSWSWLFIHRNQLIPGRQDGHPWPAKDLDPAVSQGGQDSKILRAKTLSGPKCNLSAPAVLSTEHDIVPRAKGPENLDLIFSNLAGMFNHDHGIRS